MVVSKLLVGLLVSGGVATSVTVAAVADTTESDRAVVERVVDGDTVDVSLDGTSTRVRLLNIDTPESVDPNQPVQCLGPEASEFLKSRLPPGTVVTLEYDEERTDGWGRTLAGVSTPDGTLVNAEVARQGLAAAVVIGGNDRFFPEVERARDEAVAAGRGLYSPEVACAVSAQVQDVSAAVAGIPAVTAWSTPAELDASVVAAAAVTARATALEQRLTGSDPGVVWTAYPSAERRRLAGELTAARATAQRQESAGRTAAAAARERLAQAAQERERQAALERAAVQEAARAEAEAWSRRPQSDDSGSGRASSNVAGSGGGPPGYTGPRCYAPGGKTWRPC